MDVNDLEVQRSLGRIESKQDDTLDEVKRLREDFQEHVMSDDKRFSRIDQDRNRAKGAGYVILSLITGCASIVGGAVLAVIEGWIKIKFG